MRGASCRRCPRLLFTSVGALSRKYVIPLAPRRPAERVVRGLVPLPAIRSSPKWADGERVTERARSSFTPAVNLVRTKIGLHLEIGRAKPGPAKCVLRVCQCESNEPNRTTDRDRLRQRELVRARIATFEIEIRTFDSVYAFVIPLSLSLSLWPTPIPGCVKRVV